MICQYCGHKLTDGKCLNPACPGRLRKEEDVYMGRACPPNCPGNISTSAPAEVEELLERYESSWWLLGYEAASHEDYEISEENWAKMNALKSRLLAAFSNTTPYLSRDVSVPVEEMEAGKEYDMTVRVRIESDVAKMETKPCLWVVIDGDSRKLEAWLRHAKPTFRKAGE